MPWWGGGVDGKPQPFTRHLAHGWCGVSVGAAERQPANFSPILPRSEAAAASAAKCRAVRWAPRNSSCFLGKENVPPVPLFVNSGVALAAKRALPVTAPSPTSWGVFALLQCPSCGGNV